MPTHNEGTISAKVRLGGGLDSSGDVVSEFEGFGRPLRELNTNNTVRKRAIVKPGRAEREVSFDGVRKPDSAGFCC